jgi:hypothetical protein
MTFSMKDIDMRRSNSYYKDLKQRVRKRSYPPASSPSDELGRTLDDLNAWGFLDEQAQARHAPITCYGPGVFRGYLPQTWAGVILWYKRRGYYYYDTLFLLGIWALRGENDCIKVLLGQRQLNYDLPFFNPESYYRRIQEEFRTYYKDSGTPPPADQCRYQVCYDPARRLDTRREIEDELVFWAAELKRLW